MLLTSVMNIMSYVYTVCENKKSTSTSTNMDDMEIRILYPTLSPNKMVVGSIVAGSLQKSLIYLISSVLFF